MKRALPVVFALMLGGCGTIGNLSDHPQAMGGVRNDIGEIGYAPGPCRPGCLMIVDLPFSLAIDVVFLPFTAVYELVNPKPETDK